MATKLDNPNERHYTMCGTPNFISPEVASREAHGLETDVWSLGCMMYTFLTGRPPFDAHGRPFETLDKVRIGEFLMPKDVSLEAQDLLRGLLQKDPTRRIKLTDVPSHPFMSKSSLMMMANPRAPIVSATTPINNYSSSNSSLTKVSHPK